MSRGIDWVAWPPSSHRPPLDDPGPSECKRQRYGEGAGAHDHQREPGGERGFSPENSRLGESENSDDDTADDQPGQEEEEEEEDDDEVIDLTGESDPEVLSEEEVMVEEEEEEEEEEPCFSTMHFTGGAPPESLEEKEKELEATKQTTATAGSLTPLLPLWHVLQMNKELTLADYQALRLVCRHLSRELPVLRLGGHDRVCFSYLVNKSIAHNR